MSGMWAKTVYNSVRDDVEERKITQTQYRTQFKQSVHNLIHNLTSQYT